MTFNDERYHEIFMPLEDVYDGAGPEALTEFQRKAPDGRNLVVVPLSLIDKLGSLEAANSYGAAAALRAIKETRQDKSKRLDTLPKAPFSVHRMLDTSLDLAIVNDLNLSGNPSFGSLESLIKEQPNLADAPFTLVTSNNSWNIVHSVAGGLRVQEPSFLIVDETIAERGIIFGNDSLRAELESAPHKSVDINMASEILGTELVLNQFVRFPTSSGDPDYAIVTGELVKDHSGSRILDAQNITLRLVPQREHSRVLHYGNRHDRHFTTDNVLGVKPFDIEQYLALQYCMIPRDISLFFLCGKQGSGKTVLSYAHAIDSVLWYDAENRKLRGEANPEEKGARFQQIIIMKAPEILGGKRRDPGALPGDLFMKLKHFMASYKDAHGETLLKDSVRFEDMFLDPKFENEFGGPRNPNVSKTQIGSGYLNPKQAVIELVYSGFIGGRSKRDTLFVIDEAQDYTPYEMKTILERIAIGSSVMVLGDPVQTRNPQCTVKRNGLTYAIRNYFGKPYAAVMALTKNYRSQVSEDSQGMRVYNV